jgi:hypothetical protein
MDPVSRDVERIIYYIKAEIEEDYNSGKWNDKAI